MLKNTRIGLRLGFGFATALVVIIGLSTYFYFTLTTLARLSNDAIEHKNEAIHLGEADSRLEHVGTLIATALVNKQYSAVRKELEEAKSMLAGDAQKAMAATDSAEEKIAVQRFAKNSEDYIDLLLHKELPLIEKLNLEFPNELTQINAQIDALGEAAMKDLDFLGDSFNARSVEKTKIFEERQSQARLYSMIACVAIAIFVILFSGIVTLSITRPLSVGVNFAQKVAAGDLDQSLDIDQRDEVGHLAKALRVMVDTLKKKLHEVAEQTTLARNETERAKMLTLEAETAKLQAEKAKEEGMLQAARQLESVVEIVTSASEQLSAQIEQSSQGADEQAHRMVETATSMEEMNATVLEVARNASHAAETAAQARHKAEEGARIVTQVVQGIEAVQSQSQEMKTDMENLGQKAEGIGAILNVITDIADQTNLLALNAAIEAARAGEAGRGFAVVADEVRKLAEKTMAATKEVGAAIHGIQNGTRKNMENVEVVGKNIEDVTALAATSGDSLREIVSLSERTTDQVRSIAAASEQQSAASEEINQSIEDVNRVSLETSDAMRQSAQAVGELAVQANVLKELITTMQSTGATTTAITGAATRGMLAAA